MHKKINLSSLLSDYLESNLPRPRIVELDGKNPLPFSKLEFPLGYVEKRTGGEKHRLAMRMAVHWLIGIHIHGADIKIVVHIFGRPRRHFFQNFFEIRDEERLAFLDNHRHRRMKTLNVYDTPFYPRFFENFLWQ